MRLLQNDGGEVIIGEIMFRSEIRFWPGINLTRDGSLVKNYCSSRNAASDDFAA